jgi:hypothetical protein
MSTIQINRSLFLPQIKERSAGKFSQYEDNCVDLGSETLDLAQEWFDAAPWQSGAREDYDTQRECRIALKRYVMSRISFKDVDKSWFVPDFIFIWIAQKLISYVIKLIIEHYWGDMMKDMGMEL